MHTDFLQWQMGHHQVNLSSYVSCFFHSVNTPKVTRIRTCACMHACMHAWAHTYIHIHTGVRSMATEILHNKSNHCGFMKLLFRLRFIFYLCYVTQNSYLHMNITINVVTDVHNIFCMYWFKLCHTDVRQLHVDKCSPNM